MDERTKSLAREAFELLRTQPKGDTIRLRTIAAQLKECAQGDAVDLIEHLEFTAAAFEQEDAQSTLRMASPPPGS